MFSVLGIKGFLPGKNPNESEYEFLKDAPIVVVAEKGLKKGQKVFVAATRKATGEEGKFTIRSMSEVKAEGLQYLVVNASEEGTAAFAKLMTWNGKWDSDDSASASKGDVIIPPEGSPPVDVTVVVTETNGSDAGNGGDNGASVYP